MRCPQTWEKLDPGPEADVRRCRECDQERLPLPDARRFRCPRRAGPLRGDPRRHVPPPGYGPGPVLARGGAHAEDTCGSGSGIVGRGPAPLAAPSAEQIEEIRATVSKCYSPEHLAILRLAVHNGGLPCPPMRHRHRPGRPHGQVVPWRQAPMFCLPGNGSNWSFRRVSHPTWQRSVDLAVRGSMKCLQPTTGHSGVGLAPASA